MKSWDAHDIYESLILGDQYRPTQAPFCYSWSLMFTTIKIWRSRQPISDVHYHRNMNVRSMF